MKYRKTAAGKKKVTLIPGDGVGPEVTKSAQEIIEAAGVSLEWDVQLAGAEVFKMGIPSGVTPETIRSIKETRVVLKGPLETPIGFGEKSANVTLRKLFETYGNIRPVKELPGVKTPFSGRALDIVVVRENVEDLYAGIEYMATPHVAEGIKLISRLGCEKIVRLAFELARAEGRRKVHCATKANILKFTEGMMKKVFEEVAAEYSDMEAIHIIIDNCAHQLVKMPEQFDVIVTTNMNGDIMSDLTSGLVGGLGFASSANLGNDVAMFEAVHGSAPKYAGKNVINPTALIGSAVLMLRHIDEFEAATTIEGALLHTLEEGKQMTRDIVGNAHSVSTTEFTKAVIANLGKKPKSVPIRSYQPLKLPQVTIHPPQSPHNIRQTVGVDVFVETKTDPETLGKNLERITQNTPFVLKNISNRGTQVYPLTGALTDCIDSWRCRFMLRAQKETMTDLLLLNFVKMVSEHYSWNHLEKLMVFGNVEGFTKAQGED